MRTIKVMADYQCYPLWEDSDSDDEVGDISPDTLPISQSLRDALIGWQNVIGSTLNLQTAETGFPSQAAADLFKVAGYELVNRPRQELGPGVQNNGKYPSLSQEIGSVVNIAQ